jgi:hypothetical protein
LRPCRVGKNPIAYSKRIIVMSRSDQWANILLELLVILYFSILIIGLIIRKLPVLIPLLNIAVALLIIVYWIQKQLRIDQHFIETRELVVLGIETLIIATATYFINTAHRYYWLKIIQYWVFGIHLALLLLFIVFMLTFKMNRLF